MFGRVRIIIRSVLGCARADSVQVDADGAGVESVPGNAGGVRGGCARVQVHLGGGRRPARPHVPGVQSLVSSRGRLSSPPGTPPRRQRQVAPTPAACALRSPRPAR